jgi:hypothetical protein
LKTPLNGGLRAAVQQAALCCGVKIAGANGEANGVTPRGRGLPAHDVRLVSRGTTKLRPHRLVFFTRTSSFGHTILSRGTDSILLVESRDRRARIHRFVFDDGLYYGEGGCLHIGKRYAAIVTETLDTEGSWTSFR